MKKIVNRNFEYFNKEILPYYIIIYTSIGQIVIDTNKNNLKHLLGINKSEQTKYRDMDGDLLFEYLTNNSLSLFDLIDEERYIHNNLFQEEKFILNRNSAFIDIFESLFNNPNLCFYYKKEGDVFDADYVQFCYISMAGGYLGIVGSDKSHYHYFNSIMYELDNPEKYKGTKLVVNKVEKILKADFKYENYKIVSSKRFIRSQKKNNARKAKPQKKAVLSNKDRNLINQLLVAGLKIDKGELGKKSIKIIKGDKILEKGIKLDLQALDTCQKIAQYINQNYQ